MELIENRPACLKTPGSASYGCTLKTAYLPGPQPLWPSTRGNSLAEATERCGYAIYLDDELVSAPLSNVINEGSGITNIPSEEEALTLSYAQDRRSSGQRWLELRSVGPILGENALGLSITAGMLGLYWSLFMFFYYRFAGSRDQSDCLPGWCLPF